MKTPFAISFKAAAFALAVASIPAYAQGDCYGRYEAVYARADQAQRVASQPERDSIRAIRDASNLILGYLAFQRPELPPEACGETLRRVEAQAMVWHERGWTPTAAEQEATQRAAALKRLNDALAVLEGK